MAEKTFTTFFPLTEWEKAAIASSGESQALPSTPATELTPNNKQKELVINISKPLVEKIRQDILTLTGNTLPPMLSKELEDSIPLFIEETIFQFYWGN